MGDRPITAPPPAPVTIRGRSVRNWAVTPSSGAAARVGQEVATALHQWGYRPKDNQPQQAVELLLRSAAQDGGRRVSLHLADDEERNQVMSWRSATARTCRRATTTQALRDAEHMRALAALGIRDVGMETAPSGRRWWAGLDLPRPGQVLVFCPRRLGALSPGPRKLEGPPIRA